MTAQEDATQGTLAAMMEGYDRAILSKIPGMNGPLRRSSLMDFNAGASAALMVLESRINRGEEPRSVWRRRAAHYQCGWSQDSTDPFEGFIDD